MQERVELGIGAARASAADLSALHSTAFLDSGGAEHTLRLNSRHTDFDVSALEQPPIEPTIDITIIDFPHEATVIRPNAAQANISPADTPATSTDDTVSTAVVERDIVVGTTLRARYVLHRLLGSGGTCHVFLAEDLHRRLAADAPGELLALKVLRPALRHSHHSQQRLRREFLQMQQLTHASIARVFDLDCDGDVWFMTMELVDAHNALNWMSGTYSNAEALRLILSCCEAVAYAHRKGIVHGDLKPGNVLVNSDTSVKLIDFGSVVGIEESEEATAKLEATPQYASPAVLAGNMAEAWDDVFSLGCLAYMILSRGQHPFDRRSASEAARAQLRPAYIPGIPLRLFDVVLRALAWDPAQRQSSVREFQHALITAEMAAEAMPKTKRTAAPPALDATAAVVQQQSTAAEPAPTEPALSTPTPSRASASEPSAFSQPTPSDASASEPAAFSGPIPSDASPSAPVAFSDPTPSQASPSEPSAFSEPTPSDASPSEPVAPSEPTSSDASASDPSVLSESTSSQASASEPTAPSADAADYLSRFRGYVAGPLMDRKLASPTLNLEETAEMPSPSYPPMLQPLAPPREMATTAAMNDFLSDAEVLPQSPQVRRPRATAPSRRLAVNAVGMMVVLAAAIGAAWLSSQSAPAREPPRIVVSRMTMPVLTIPAPNIDPIPMPTVQIARDSKPAKPPRRRPATVRAPRTASTPAAASVSFESRDVEVSPTQNLVAITIRRSEQNPGPAQVGWFIEGRNARQLLDERRAGAQVIQFHQGQRTRTLYVPLRKDAGDFVAEGVRTFRVKLRKVEDGPAPERAAEVRVTLLDR